MDPFLGQTILFAGNFAPRGWALCEGQILPINSNQALFSILGTMYGGDGRTTFALPDLRGRAPVSEGVGAGIPPVNLGQKGGNVATQLTVANLPAAQVSLPASTDEAPAGGVEPDPTKVLATPSDDKQIYAASATTTLANGSVVGAGNTAFSNQQPYLALNYIIALQGVFPSRS